MDGYNIRHYRPLTGKEGVYFGEKPEILVEKGLTKAFFPFMLGRNWDFWIKRRGSIGKGSTNKRFLREKEF